MNLEKNLEMNLLSDAIPGSGEGLAGIIDTDISYDEYGIPFIPSKRIKGILRESAKELSDAGLLTTSINKIFGESGTKEGCDFKISNGYINEYEKYKNFLKETSKDNDAKTIFNREAILDYFTYDRAQTTVDRVTGMAKENTLRFSRVVKKGLTFNFILEFNSDHEEKLKNIIKVTRSFGISRTRGPGHIKMELKNLSQSKSYEKLNSTVSNDEELCTLPVEISNLSQLLLSIRVGEDQVSEKYIPGSFILGALAYNYIRNKNKPYNPSEDNDFRDIFVSGEVTFSNGYPVVGDEIFYPVPLSIVKEKDTSNYYDFAFEEEPIQKKGDYEKFVTINSGENSSEVEFRSTLTEIEYHHRRPYDKSIGHAKKFQTGQEGIFFQFQVISPGQNFKGNITGKYKYIKKLSETLNKDMNFYIGKSKTAQYGKCSFKFGEIKKIEDDKTWYKDNTLIITLASDMILIDENGFNRPDVEVFKKELADTLEIELSDTKISIEKKFLKYKKVGGFLGVWNLPKPQYVAIAAGSVLVLQNGSEKDISLNNLTGKSFGTRIEEGFGKILIDWHGNNGITKKEPAGEPPDWNVVKQSSLKDFIEYILSIRLKMNLRNKAIKNANNSMNLPSGSFIGKVLSLIEKAVDFDDLKNNNINELRERAEKQLEKISDHLYLHLWFEKDIVRITKEIIEKLKGNIDTNELETLKNKYFKKEDLIRKIKSKFTEKGHIELILKYVLEKKKNKIYITDEIKFLRNLKELHPSHGYASIRNILNRISPIESSPTEEFYQITSEVIENLKTKIPVDKLETLQTLIDKVFSLKELNDILNELSFTKEEIGIVVKQALTEDKLIKFFYKNNNIFKLYKYYVKTYLTTLIYKKRREKSGRG